MRILGREQAGTHTYRQMLVSAKTKRRRPHTFFFVCCRICSRTCAPIYVLLHVRHSSRNNVCLTLVIILSGTRYAFLSYYGSMYTHSMHIISAFSQLFCGGRRSSLRFLPATGHAGRPPIHYDTRLDAAELHGAYLGRPKSCELALFRTLGSALRAA